MEYDKSNVPNTYDAGREISESKKHNQLDYFIKNIQKTDVANVIDLGCGTGRYSLALADTFDAPVVGVDPSRKMLDQARSKFNDSRISFVDACGESIPLSDGSADLVFMSMVLHHLTSVKSTAQECGRVLRGQGKVCIRNTVAEEISSYPYLGYFPNIRSIIQHQLISKEYLIECFQAAGFELIAHQSVWSEISTDWRSFADKIALRADSFVAQLDESEFVSGLSMLQIKAEGSGSDEKVGLNVDSFVFQKL